MKQVEELIASFSEDPAYDGYVFLNKEKPTLWNAYPKAWIFFAADHCAVVLHGPIHPDGRVFSSFNVFYPDYMEETGRPWARLHDYLCDTAGLGDKFETSHSLLIQRLRMRVDQPPIYHT